LKELKQTFVSPIMSDPISSNPSSPEAAPVTSVTEPTAPASGLQPNIAAVLACFFSFVGGIVFLVLEKKNKFVRFYAAQSTVFGLGIFAIFIALAIISVIMGQIPMLGGLVRLFIVLVELVLSLANLAVWIITMVNAFNNKEWEIPYVGAFARKQLESGILAKI